MKLREALQPEEARQVASGETLSQTRVELKPLGSEMFCAREILWEQILVPVREFENETFCDASNCVGSIWFIGESWMSTRIIIDL